MFGQTCHRAPAPYHLDAPRGGKFGMLIDRFGNEWMVSKM
jgi:hypothetical protein